MSARFLILFPDKPDEVAMASHLVATLKNSIDDCWVCRLIREDLLWISDGYSSGDETIIYSKSPGEKRRAILDLIPDYLIDLSGEGKYWLFKNRIRLMDFSFKAKAVGAIRRADSFGEKKRVYFSETASLLSVFEIDEIENQRWNVSLTNEHFDRIPESFRDGFAGLNLDDFKDTTEATFQSLVEFLSVMDYPVILSGSTEMTDFGDRLTNKVGCTVFNIAGVFEENMERTIFGNSRAFIGTGERTKFWTDITLTRFADFKLGEDPQRLRKQLKEGKGK